MKKIILGMALLLLMQHSIFAQKGKPEALVMIGSTSGLLLYNTYVTIGAIGDGFEKDVYKSDYVKDVMVEQVNGLKSVRKECQKTLDAGFFTDTADKDYFVRIMNEMDDLSDYALALSDYAANTSIKNADTFQDIRDKCWKEIADLLGIKQ